MERRAAARYAGSDLDLGVEFVLAPGWHVYWKNSGDAGYAPKLDLTATPAISSSALLFPAPHRFELPGDLVSFGYEGEVIYPVTGRLLPPEEGELTIAGQLDYLVCAEECIPYRADLALRLPSHEAPPQDPAAAEGDRLRLSHARRTLPLPAASAPGAPRIEAAIERGDYPFSTLVLSATGGTARLAGPDLFFETHREFAVGRPELTIGDGGFRFRVPIRPLDETRPAPAATTFAWTLTGLEGDGGPFAIAGESQVALPAVAPAGRRWWLWSIISLGAAASLFALLRSRSPIRSKHPVPKEAS